MQNDKDNVVKCVRSWATGNDINNIPKLNNTSYVSSIYLVCCHCNSSTLEILSVSDLDRVMESDVATNKGRPEFFLKRTQVKNKYIGDEEVCY